MRIDRLDLIAYGPFADTTLDLSEGDRGLHLIVGPNEAGKSTTLRALRGWLFGFPHRLDDNFRHRNDAIRVGGVLRDEDGDRLEIIRRKTLKRSLRGADDEAEIEEEILSGRFLGGIAEDLFSRMFAIDHAGLSAGGAAAMKAGGEFASILFGSGLDLAELRSYQKYLESEIEKLFKPTGSLPRINAALTRLEEARREIESASLKGADWSERVQELDELRRRKAEVDRRWREVTLGRERLGRIRRALPDLARRAALREQLDGLSDAPRLPADFPARRRGAEDRRLAAEANRAAAEREADRLRDECAEIPPPAPILGDAEAIDAIPGALVAEQKAAQQRDKQARKRTALIEQARANLVELGREDDPASVAVARPRPGLKERLNKLTNDALSIRFDRDAARTQGESARRTIADLQRESATLPPLRRADGLSRALARVSAKGDFSEAREMAVRERSKAEREAKSLRAKLGELDLATDEIALLPVPSAEVIERFREEIAAAEAEREEARRRYDATEDELLSLVARIERERGSDDLPDEPALETSRAERDGRWKALRASWRAGSPPDDLIEEFEAASRKADGIADRLRREAERVAARAQDRAAKAALAESLAAHRRRREEADARSAELARRWAELWKPLGLAARAPREMAAWAQAHAKLVEKAGAIAEARGRIARIDASIADCVAELHRELEALGESVVARESLDSARDRAAAVVEEIRAEAERRRLLDRSRTDALIQLEEAEARLQAADAEDRAWRASWAAAVAPLGLDPEAPPDRASLVLDATLALAKALDDAAEITREIEAGEAESAAFSARLDDLAARHAPMLGDAGSDAAAEGLKAALREARGIESKRSSARESLERAEASIRGARDDLDRATRALVGLAQEAGTDDPAKLPEIERRALNRTAAERALREVEDRLLAIAPGRPIDAIAAEAAGAEMGSIQADLAVLDEEFARLDEERQGLSHQVGDREASLRALEDEARKGRAEAAASGREHLVGALESDVDRYVHLRLASAVLRGAIEEFREKNEAPVLRRASDHFARLTLGSFIALRADLDEKDEPLLVGVRADGTTRVPVSGMSVGSADQLYLALKLASLEHYLRTRPALPLIVDDLLVQFDDARAAAALECLAELSRTTQILFFTHHEHLVELARDRLPEDVLFVHRLGGTRREAVLV